MIRFITFRPWAAGFIRYTIVGLANTTVGLSITLLLLNKAGCSYYWTATAAGTTAGVALSYVLNRRFTFRSRMSVAGSLSRFVVVTVLCYAAAFGCSRPFGALLADILVEYGAASGEQAAHLAGNIAALLGSAAYTGLGYAGHRYWTFRSHSLQGGSAISHDRPDPL